MNAVERRLEETNAPPPAEAGGHHAECIHVGLIADQYDGDAAPEALLSYRLHEWDPEGLRRTPVVMVCLHCGRGIDEIQRYYALQCVPGRPIRE